MSDRTGGRRERVEEAVAQLRSLRCPDRAAAPAMRAIQLTVHTLEQLWLPALERGQW